MTRPTPGKGGDTDKPWSWNLKWNPTPQISLELLGSWSCSLFNQTQHFLYRTTWILAELRGPWWPGEAYSPLLPYYGPAAVNQCGYCAGHKSFRLSKEHHLAFCLAYKSLPSPFTSLGRDFHLSFKTSQIPLLHNNLLLPLTPFSWIHSVRQGSIKTLRPNW